MIRIKQMAPALLAALVLAACGGGASKNNDDNNTSNTQNNDNNTSNTQNNDLCGVGACPALTDACTGQIAVSYSGAGTCDPADGSCDYSAVETRTDCSAAGQTCVAGACVDSVDLCADVTCDMPPAPTCEGNEAVTFAAGVCDAGTGVCDYSASQMRTDCVALGQLCAIGSCIDPGPEPNPGELVITEIMADPAAVADSAGEWFEVRNTTTRDLDLNGLLIIDDDGDEFAIPAGTAMLAAGELLVFGVNADTATNGGVGVDIEYTGINLANSADELVIVDANDVEIDRVAWDEDNGWTVPTGASMQFAAQSDFITDDNNDPQFWCASITPIGGGDFGTPGADNDMCPQPVVVTLYQLSNDADPDYPGVNVPVEVLGVAVTALDVTNGYMWLQETAGGAYSGIYVDTGAVDVSALAVGDVVDIAGAYDEWNGTLARITASSIIDTGNDMSIAPEVLESSVLADPATAEPWEGVLIQINEAGVTDIDAGAQFGEVMVDSNIVVDDLLFDGFTTAVECEVYEMVIGPLNYSFGAFKIEPRDANDIGASVMAIASTDVDVQNFAFDAAAICISAGDTVTWTNLDAQAHTVTERLASITAPAANIPATPAFDEMLAGNGGTATVTFAEPGSYHYRCRPHPAMEGIVVVPDP